MKKCVQLKLEHRGFVLSLEAGICLAIAVFCSCFLFLLQPHESLNDILLFQVAQDAVEVCAQQFDLSVDCVKTKLGESGFKLDVNSDKNCGGVLIERVYGEKEIAICIMPYFYK
jgi:hypothetical protein